MDEVRRRTHTLSQSATEARLGITHLSNRIEKTADKDDVDRIESEVKGLRLEMDAEIAALRGLIIKAAIGISGSSLAAALGVIIAVTNGG
jgi:hypothetical protein